MINVKKNALMTTLMVFGLLIIFVTYSVTGNMALFAIYFIYGIVLLKYYRTQKQTIGQLSKKAQLTIKLDELYNDERELNAIMIANRFATHAAFKVLVILGILCVSFSRSLDQITISLSSVGIVLLILAFLLQLFYVTRLFYELRDN
jgi:hypothetical protein